MRITRALAAAAAVVVAAAGCSSPPAHPAGPAAVLATASASRLAARLGCRHYKAAVPPGRHTRTEGSCTLDGRQVVLATFSTGGGQRAWVQAENGLGGFLVQGSRWAANAETAATARIVAVRLRGRQ